MRLEENPSESERVRERKRFSTVRCGVVRCEVSVWVQAMGVTHSFMFYFLEETNQTNQPTNHGVS